MNDFVRESVNQGSSGGGSKGGSSSNNIGGGNISLDDKGDGRATNPNYMNLDGPPPPAPRNPDPKFDRDDSDPLTDSPGIKGSNKKRKRRKGKRDLRRGGFLSSLKIDRGSSMGGSDKKNPYSIGGM